MVQTEIWVRVCYLCYHKGKLKQAEFSYTTEDETTYDACLEHIEMARENGFDITPLDPEETTMKFG